MIYGLSVLRIILDGILGSTGCHVYLYRILDDPWILRHLTSSINFSLIARKVGINNEHRTETDLGIYD